MRREKLWGWENVEDEVSFFFFLSRGILYLTLITIVNYIFRKKKEKFAEVNRANIVYVKLLLNLIDRNTFLSYVFFPRNIFLTKNLRID